ncbi:MAG: four-helix bundle copper-binding protein [Limnohabitans sp.]
MLTQIEKECLLACQACAAACWQCASACLKEDDPKAMVRCIELDMGCADLCQLTAASIARGDEHAQALCTLCAQVCKACAAQCIQHTMAHCQDCAQACQRCAVACHRMGG